MAIQAQFYGSRNNDGSSLFCNNGYCCDDGFVESSCFNLQQHHNQKQQLHWKKLLQQFYNENPSSLHYDSNNLLVYDPKLNNNHLPTSSKSPSTFPAKYDMQRDQIDHYIRLENVNLRFMLQEQERQQVSSLLKSLESQSLSMLREKDEEITQVSMKRLELENYVRRLEAENQAWQKVAQENEAMALSLHKTLEEMKERILVAANDEESCCDEAEFEEEHVDVKDNTLMLCKSCQSRTSSYLFLPCRHLCSCKDCETFLEACPVCGMQKKGSIETLIL